MSRLTPSDWGLYTTLQVVGAHDVGYVKYGGGMRFTNITIPKDTNIIEAHLTLHARYTRTADVVNSRISAEDIDDAPTFADSAAAFDTRWAARTEAKVDWDAMPAWTANVDYDSPDIKAVIQEIVNREGWASGQDIVIFWDDFDGRRTEAAGCRRDGYSYDKSTVFAPKLHIRYTAGS
ncbi:hypothetical protein ES708_33265 [subsurface metagenome]